MEGCRFAPMKGPVTPSRPGGIPPTALVTPSAPVITGLAHLWPEVFWLLLVSLAGQRNHRPSEPLPPAQIDSQTNSFLLSCKVLIARNE